MHFTDLVEQHQDCTVRYVRDKNPSIKLQLGTMGVFPYNKHDSHAQKCTIAEHNDTVCHGILTAYHKTTILLGIRPQF